MNRFLRFCLPTLSVSLISALSAMAQMAPPPGGPGAAPGFKNLKVLPANISPADLRNLMHQFTGDLGVECTFCHAANPATNRPDFPSDANPVKDSARFMIHMTDDLNKKYLAEMPNRHDADSITCGTCHRGEKHPSIFVPPQRAPGNGPGAPPPGAAPPAPRPGN